MSIRNPPVATGARGWPGAAIANKSVSYGWSGRGDLNARPPAPKALDALIWASIDSTTCGPCLLGLVETLATIWTVNPPTTPTGSPAGSADCEINRVWLLWNDAPAGGMKTAAILGGGIS